MNSFEITELSRKLNNLIRLGTVIEADYSKPKVRVKIGNLTTNWLDFLIFRAGNVKIWNPPEIGEQVIVLSPDGDLSQGIVLPSLLRDMFPALSTKSTDTIIQFADNTKIKYDSEAKELTAVLVADGKAAITAPGGLTVAGDITVSGNIEVTGTITSTGDQLAGAISQQTHVHGGVETGGGTTSVPQ